MTARPADAGGPAGDEFVCVECGRHIVRFPAMPGPKLCGACLLVPGWHDDPELARVLDPPDPAA